MKGSFFTKQSKNGITLIALVVTIVVLLILAGVSISMLAGENGIINNAQKASDETKNAKEKEEQEFLKTDDLIYGILAETEVTQTEDANPGELEGEGTEVNPYTINSIEDLVFFSYDVRNGNTYAGEYVKLGISLDFKDTKSYVEEYREDYGEYGYNGALKTLLTSGEGWIPIGNISNESSNFYGIFDGNNFTIFNIYINKHINIPVENEQNYGLFSVNRGTIKNLNITADMEINATTNNIFLGGLVGQNGDGGIIQNCCSDGNIKVYGTEEMEQYIGAGGIAGQNSKAKIEYCKNSANIKGDYHRAYIGGIMGSNHEASVYASYNIGKITLENYYGHMERAGGIAGQFYRSDMNYCFNLGEMIGNYRTGALVGYLQSSSSNMSKIANSIYKNSTINGLGNYETNNIQEPLIQVEITKDESLTEERILNILKNIE